MRADEHRIELDALRAEGIEHELVRHIERRLRKARAAEAVLVGDHREPEAGGAAPARMASNTPGHEADLLDGIDLLVGRLLDQRAVAVDEKYALVVAHARLRIRVGRSVRACPRRCAALCGDSAAHVADQQLAHGARRPVQRPASAKSDEQEIGVAGPHLAHCACRRECRREPLAFGAHLRDALALDGELRRRQRCEHRLDGELRDGIGRNHLARAARRWRARAISEPHARAGEAEGLGQGAQHHEVREARQRSRERLRRRENSM